MTSICSGQHHWGIVRPGVEQPWSCLRYVRRSQVRCGLECGPSDQGMLPCHPRVSLYVPALSGNRFLADLLFLDAVGLARSSLPRLTFASRAAGFVGVWLLSRTTVTLEVRTLRRGLHKAEHFLIQNSSGITTNLLSCSLSVLSPVQLAYSSLS
jgi:hypothetical protein